MNLADLVLGITLLGIIVVGFGRGLVGIALYSLATLLSVIAGVAVTLATAAAPVPDAWLLILVPVVFFLTFGIILALLRGVAARVTGLWHRLPAALADRVLGALLALGVGVFGMSLLVFAVLEAPVPVKRLTAEVMAGRSTPILLAAGAAELEVLARPFPVLTPLADRLARVRDEVRAGRAGLPSDEI